jgi:hypothetical protein
VALLAHQVQHLVGGVRIEVGGGLVGDHQRRPLDQRTRDRHALALAARQRVGPVRGMPGQAHGVQHAPATRWRRSAHRHAGDEQRVVHVVGHRHHRHQVEALEDEADGVAAQQRGLRSRPAP